MKKINLIIPLMLSFVSLVSADIGDEFSCGMFGGMYGNYGLGGMFFGWAFGILALVALILLIALLIKKLQKK